MKFNLRGLLAYLDDRLTPESAALVGDYISENDRMRQLTDRIKRVVRRRRLSTPDVAERQELPPHHQDDPNEVAAYLDGRMTEEQEADFEQICIDTDVYLAEVAACHQIMTFGQDTLKVPPLARQRMYSLVKGPEAQPLKVVPREPRPSKPPLWEVDGVPTSDPEDQALLEPLYHSLLSSRWRQALLGLCALLFINFFAYLAWSLPWQTWSLAWADQSLQLPREAHQAPAAHKEVALEPARDAQPADGNAPVALPAAQLPMLQLENLWPIPVFSYEGQPSWQAAAEQVASLGGMVAGRPTLPWGLFLGLGREDSKPAEVAQDALVPLPVLASNKPRVAAPDRTTKVAIATNGAEALGMFTQWNDVGDFSILKPAAPLLANQKLMALPGYSGNIALTDHFKLLLLGQFHVAVQGQPCAEAVVELHPSMEVDLDFTLLRGRVVLQGRPLGKPAALVRLRYQGETWELTLPAGAEAGIQAYGNLQPGEDAWKVHHTLEIITSKGEVEVKLDEYAVTLRPKHQWEWKSIRADRAPVQSELAEIPVWLAKYQTAPREAVESLVALRSRTHAKLEQNGSDLKWFALACEEGLEQGKLVDRQVAIQGLLALQRLKPVLQLQNDPQANGRRKFSHDAVQQWLGQDANRAVFLLNQLKEIGYSDEDARLLLALYRGTNQKSADRLQTLLQALGNEHVAIREEAWRLLTALYPERPNIYDAALPLEQRNKAITILHNRLQIAPSQEVLPP